MEVFYPGSKDIKQRVHSSNISETLFLEHLCAMVYLSSIEKDSLATTRDPCMQH